MKLFTPMWENIRGNSEDGIPIIIAKHIKRAKSEQEYLSVKLSVSTRFQQY